MPTPTYSFPLGFLWGAATAAHQIEGNNVNADWWEREHRPGGDVSEPSGDADDSYNRYAQDISLLADSGLNTYRFSVEWARVEPEEGFFSRAQILHYRGMIEACLEAGVTPMVTLNHMTLPRWLAHRGGWRDPASTDLFGRYVEHLLPILDGVTWVCTINEPNMVALTQGGQEGTDMAAASLPTPDPVISRSLVKAHRRAREVLSRRPGLRSGWTIACQDFQALPGCEREMEKYRYPREEFFSQAAKGDDFIGVQAYLRTFIGTDGPRPVPAGAERTLTGWEYYPAALGEAVRYTWQAAGYTPIVVTENGIATADDSRRIDYTFEALSSLYRAMIDGVAVEGYIHWSLLDNYEWGSYKPTFGLVSVDHETFERRPKPSLEWLGRVAKTGLLRRD